MLTDAMIHFEQNVKTSPKRIDVNSLVRPALLAIIVIIVGSWTKVNINLRK